MTRPAALKVGAVLGPTAVGKTELAIEVAERIGAEIVSVDSMQIYRGMDIGTAKPEAALRSRVPHHLLDLKEPEETLTVAEFQALGRGAIEDIAARGLVPLLVGGSGLYFRAIVDDLRFPPRSEDVRGRLEDEVDRDGAEVLHARLAGLDPVAASRIEPANARRTVRALEVIELTGRPFSENDAWNRYESRYRLAAVGLERERDDLYERIARRVDDMLERGLIAEVERLAPRLGVTAGQALGYKQVLELGSDVPAVREAIVSATKRFARRQASWFRSDPRIEWLHAGAPEAAPEAARLIAGSLDVSI